MHVEVDAGTVECNLDPRGERHVQSALHVQQVKQTVVHQLVHDHDVRYRRAAPHQQCDVRVPQNALHNNFVLDFGQQLVRDVRVKNFLDGHWRPVQEALVDHREAALADLLTHLHVAALNLSHAWHSWQAARGRGDFSRTLGEGGEVGLHDLLLKSLYLVTKQSLLPLFLLQLVLQVCYARVACARSLGPVHRTSLLGRREIHPVAVAPTRRSKALPWLQARTVDV